MISLHLPAIQVAFPLICAPICAIINRENVCWAFATTVAWLAFIISVAILAQVVGEGVISYPVGHWDPPWGIELRLDALNSLVLVMITGVGAVIATYARDSVIREIAPHQRHFFYAAMLLNLTGVIGIVVTGDAFNVYVFVEISSLSAYILIAMGNDRRALHAAYQYVVLGTLGATFYLIGVGLLYMMTGSLNMADLAEHVRPLGDNRTIIAGFGFITIGLALKLALFPLHLWLPNAYAFAPSIASAFLAATSTKAMIYVLIRMIFTLFGSTYAYQSMALTEALAGLAVAAMIIGTVVAIFQGNVKRMLAYSSIAQIGYIILGIALGTASGVMSAIIHVFNHGLIKGGMFLAVGCVAYRLGGASFAQLRGLGRRMPFTVAALIGGGLSLIGVPLTAGFVSKWYLLIALIEAGWWPVAVIVLLTSVLAAVYVWRIVEAAYFAAPTPETAAVAEAPWTLLLPTWVLIGATIYFGIHTDLTVGMARMAAQALLGGVP